MTRSRKSGVWHRFGATDISWLSLTAGFRPIATVDVRIFASSVRQPADPADRRPFTINIRSFQRLDLVVRTVDVVVHRRSCPTSRHFRMRKAAHRNFVDVCCYGWIYVATRHHRWLTLLQLHRIVTGLLDLIPVRKNRARNDNQNRLSLILIRATVICQNDDKIAKRIHDNQA